MGGSREKIMQNMKDFLKNLNFLAFFLERYIKAAG